MWSVCALVYSYARGDHRQTGVYLTTLQVIRCCPSFFLKEMRNEALVEMRRIKADLLGPSF